MLRQLPILGLFALTLAVGALLGATPAEASSNCVYTLTTTVSGGGGDIGVSPGNSFACPEGTYHGGASVTVIATALPGYAWESWSGTDDNSNRISFVIMNGDQSVKATFGSNCHALTTTVSGNGGEIGVAPGNTLGCPERQYALGTPVTVIATANPGYVWKSWSGTDDNSDRISFVIMDGNRSVKATFSTDCHSLTTTVSGGGGVIGVAPGNTLGCPELQYSLGTSVTVIATATSGHTWESWTGTDDNSDRISFVIMNGDRSVKATFSDGGSTPPPAPAPTSTPVPTSTPAPQPTAAPTDTPPANPTNTPTNTPPQDSTATPSPTSPPNTGPASGDVNCDGRTSSIDAALVLQYSAGLVSTLPCLDQGDILDDDDVNALDAAIILQIAAQLL